MVNLNVKIRISLSTTCLRPFLEMSVYLLPSAVPALGSTAQEVPVMRALPLPTH